MKHPFVLSTLSLSVLATCLNAHALDMSVVYKDGLAEYECKKPIPKNPDLKDATLTCLFHDNDTIGEISHQDKVGLIDKDGTLITDIKYDKIQFYDDEYLTAQASLNGKHGLISTKTGKELTAIHFDGIHLLKQDRMPVSLQGKYGYIDHTGRMVIAPKYGNAYSFNKHGLALVANGNVKDGTYRQGVIDVTGKEILRPVHRYLSPSDDGRIYFTDESGFQGVMDRDGNIVIKAEYPLLGGFEHGFANVLLTQDLWGYIDSSGQEIITPQYQYAKAPAKIGDKVLFIVAKHTAPRKYGILDKDGHVLIDFIYQDILALESGNLIVAMDENSHYLLLNQQLKPITPAVYDKFIYFNDKLGIYEKSGKFGFIDTYGKELTSAKFDDIEFIYSQTYQNLQTQTTNHGFVVKIGNQFGFFDHDGKEQLAVMYDEIDHINTSNRLIFKKQGRYGVADFKGKIITPPTYDSVKVLSDDYLKAKMDDTWYLIDPTGNNLGKTSAPK